MVKGSTFHDGTIDVAVAGRPASGAVEGARGFIGMAFRIRDGRFEYIYLRPTNGRADDQVRRNHSTQYSAHPDFRSPSAAGFAGKVQSYVDLEPGAWTRCGSSSRARRRASSCMAPRSPRSS